MNSIKALIIVFIFVFPFPAFSQDYKHYDDHHDEEHHKPDEHSGDEKSDGGDEEIAEDDQDGFGFTFIPRDSLSKIKGVIISADVDGPTGENTLAFKERMKSTAEFLRDKGMVIHEFFCPNDNWDKIVEKTAGAHILIYSGHGVYDGSTPPKWVGGFSLTNRFVSSKELQDQLKLAPNAIVIFNQACFTAGSAGGDVGDIGLPEAHRRVSIYAHPFIDLGVGCYYANNFYNSAGIFVGEFLKKKTVKDIYQEQASSWSTIIEEKPYEFNKQYTMGISRYGKDQYCVAYVGRPGFTIREWFSK
jgi:hypothetical protein